MSKLIDETMKKRLENPFEAQSKKGQEHTLKFCAWEVLRNYPQGLNVSQIAKEIHNRGLKDFSRRKNASGQVSGDLVRGRDVFWHDPIQKLWWIRPLAPTCRTTSVTTREDSSLPFGADLVGQRVSVWWEGEQRYYEGAIRSFEIESNTYSIDYDDGDEDNYIQLRKYTVDYQGDKIHIVTVYQHNLDDTDQEDDNSEVVEEETLQSKNTDGKETESKSLEDGEDVSKTCNSDEPNLSKNQSNNSTNKNITDQEEVERENGGEVESVEMNQRKRRLTVGHNETELKKPKIEPLKTESLSEEAVVTNVVPQENNEIDMKLPRLELNESNVSHEQEKEESKPASVARVVEMIDVLDLTKQLKPPRDKCPSYRNLKDASELMSLSELSSALRPLDNDEAVDTEEVTSSWKDPDGGETNKARSESSDFGQSSDHRNQLLETVPCLKGLVPGNVESRLLTSLGTGNGSASSSPPQNSDELQRMDNFISNGHDGLLCSPPVLSRTPRL